MHDALLQAGLTDADEPLMAWRDSRLGRVPLAGGDRPLYLVGQGR